MSKEPQAERSLLHLGSADLTVRSRSSHGFFLADSLPPAEVEESVSRRRGRMGKEPQAKRSSLHLGSADKKVRSRSCHGFFLADSLPPAEVEESVSRRRRGG
jgi:hypothetical protein